MNVSKRIKKEYEDMFRKIGETEFFNHLFKSGIVAREKFEYPENMMLDQSEAFFSLFRTTGNKNYFIIGKILRRAAHKIYRENKKVVKDYPKNARFLDSIEM